MLQRTFLQNRERRGVRHLKASCTFSEEFFNRKGECFREELFREEFSDIKFQERLF
jgi:hypothetical protein